MNLSEIGEIINKNIKEKYGSQREFAKKTNRNYVVLNTLINKLLTNKNVTYDRLFSILDDLDLEIKLENK